MRWRLRSRRPARGKLRIAVSEIEIVRTGDHLPEQHLALRIDIGGAETFHRGAESEAAREGVWPPMTRHAAIAPAIAVSPIPSSRDLYCAYPQANRPTRGQRPLREEDVSQPRLPASGEASFLRDFS